jgi:hypothetical protein
VLNARWVKTSLEISRFNLVRVLGSSACLFIGLFAILGSTDSTAELVLGVFLFSCLLIFDVLPKVAPTLSTRKGYVVFGFPGFRYVPYSEAIFGVSGGSKLGYTVTISKGGGFWRRIPATISGDEVETANYLESIVSGAAAHLSDLRPCVFVLERSWMESEGRVLSSVAGSAVSEFQNVRHRVEGIVVRGTVRIGDQVVECLSRRNSRVMSVPVVGLAHGPEIVGFAYPGQRVVMDLASECNDSGKIQAYSCVLLQHRGVDGFGQ